MYEILENTNYKTKEFLKELEIKDEDILEQIPAEKPKWLFESPGDETNQSVFFVGESTGEEKFETAYESAKMNSMIDLCKFIKNRVDMDIQGIKEARSEENSQKLIKKIASISKNTFMRESKVIDRYYLKLKPSHNMETNYFQFYVLLSYPKKNVEDAVKESLIYEKELLSNIASEEELKKLQKSIENFGQETSETEIRKKMDRERKILFTKSKIENLYIQNIRAEEAEKKGKLLAAYREYVQLLDKINSIINSK